MESCEYEFGADEEEEEEDGKTKFEVILRCFCEQFFTLNLNTKTLSALFLSFLLFLVLKYFILLRDFSIRSSKKVLPAPSCAATIRLCTPPQGSEFESSVYVGLRYVF